MANRKELYEALHPETRKGALGGGRDGKGTRKTESATNSFSVDTAAKTKRARRTIEQDVRIATALPDSVRNKLRGTSVEDRKSDLLKLARMDEAERRIGELMKAQREQFGTAQGKRTDLGPTKTQVESPKITLAEVGIDKGLADRASDFR